MSAEMTMRIASVMEKNTHYFKLAARESLEDGTYQDRNVSDVFGRNFKPTITVDGY